MLNLSPTHALHNQLAALAPSEGPALRRALETANRELVEQRLTFGRVKPLSAALTALVLDANDVKQLRRAAEALHAIVEKVLAFVIDSPENRARYFPDHARLFPYLAKTRGVDSWQVVSRYDVAITPDGRLKLMELNTGCPGGFLIAEAMSDVTRHGFAELDGLVTSPNEWAMNATIRPNTLVDELLALEAAAGIEPDAVGVLNDENDLSFELDLLVDSFRMHGRQAAIADARSLRRKNDTLLHGDQALSLVYNKFRISTPESPNHCWKAGFEKHYKDFLAAQRAREVVSVNNVGGMLLAEDKSLLALLHEPEIRSLFTKEEIALIDMHVLWTAKLQEGNVDFHGREIDLMPFVLKNRERCVVKPANEGRGFGVVVGKYATDAEWISACAIDPHLPKVVQEFTEAASFPVISLGGTGDAPAGANNLCVRPMLLTLGLAIIRGKYQGIVSRVSANAVTNVAREGFGQGVFIRRDG